MLIRKNEKTDRTITVPGDKSIFHRAAIIASLTKGVCEISNIPQSLDCLSTINCLKSLGVEIKVSKNGICTVNGKTAAGFIKKTDILDAGNSATTLRLLSGILPSLPFSCSITGDRSLQKRPMKRIVLPLREMGAKITCNRIMTAPLHFDPAKTRAIRFVPENASSQVKSAVLLAALFAEGTTILTEKISTRDHLENLFNFTGIKIYRKNKLIAVEGPQAPRSFSLNIAGDFSSAAYFIALACCIDNYRITVKNICLNPSRTGLLRVISRMGADISISEAAESIPGEAAGDITVTGHKRLTATNINADEIPSLIDELPVIAVVATQASGTTTISGAGELRLKESDRISSIVSELKKMGADIAEKSDGIIINGGKKLKGAVVTSHGDHRIAMSLAIAAHIADGETNLLGQQDVRISFPDFFSVLEK